MGGPLQDEDFPPGGPGDDFIPPGFGANQVQHDGHPAFPPPQHIEVPNIPDLNAQPDQNIPEPALPNGIIVDNDAEMEDAAEINRIAQNPVEEQGEVQNENQEEVHVENQEEINLQPSDSFFHGSPASLASVGNIPVGNGNLDGGLQEMNDNHDHEIPATDQQVFNQIQIGQVFINAQFNIPEDTFSSNFSYAKANAVTFTFPDVLLPAKLTDGITSPALNLNDKMGLTPDVGPVFQPNKPSPDVFRLWAKHFSPVDNPGIFFIYIFFILQFFENIYVTIFFADLSP